MMQKKDRNITVESIKKVKFQMIIWFSSSATLLVIILSCLIMRQTNNILKNKVAALLDELNIQSSVILDTYISQVESTADYIQKTTEPLYKQLNNKFSSEIENQKSIKELNNFLSNFCDIRKYTELAILFENGTYAGTLNRAATLPEYLLELYTEMKEELIKKDSDEAWISGDINNFYSILFTKQLYPDVIFICSLKTSKINEFINSANLINLTSKVMNEKQQIIFSTNPDEIGRYLSNSIMKNLDEKAKKNRTFNNKIFAKNTCSNGWVMITSAEVSEIMKERKNLITYIIVLTSLAISFILIFCIVFSLKLTIPIEHLFTSLHNQATKDRITKLLNAETFYKCAEEMINEKKDENMAIFFMDIDHYNTIIDIKGRSESDKIIFDVSDSLRRTFPKESIIGRISTDRFMACTKISPKVEDNNSVACLCEKLQQELFTKFQGDFDITMSIGISLYPSHGKTFRILCDMSERAMNSVKRTTRNNWHIFDPSKDFRNWT